MEKEEKKEILLLEAPKEIPRSVPFSTDLKVPDKGLASQRAKQLVSLAMRSPNHGKHGRAKKTLIKEEVYKKIQEKLLERSFKLLNTQTVLAHGAIKIYKIKSEWVGAGKKKWLKKGKPQLVKNDHEIASVINWEFGDRNEDENPNSDEEYFFVVTQDPDNRAIKDQLDRVFGPATQKVTLDLSDKTVEKITGMEIIREQIPIHEDSISLQ